MRSWMALNYIFSRLDGHKLFRQGVKISCVETLIMFHRGQFTIGKVTHFVKTADTWETFNVIQFGRSSNFYTAIDLLINFFS